MRNFKVLSAATLLVLTISGCANSLVNMATLQNVQFTLDTGEIRSFSVGRQGARGEQTEEYAITGSGTNTAYGKTDTTFRYAFSVNLKKDVDLAHVKVERITPEGKAILIVEDTSPMRANAQWYKQADGTQVRFVQKSWVGQSKEMSVGRAIPIKEGLNMKKHVELFKFTLRDKAGTVRTMYQPSLIENFTLEKN